MDHGPICTHLICTRHDVTQCDECPAGFYYCPLHAGHPDHHFGEEVDPEQTLSSMAANAEAA